MHTATGRLLLASIPTVILMFGGCVSAPTHEDPLAGLTFPKAQNADPLEGQSFTDMRKADLTLAMVISQNSKNAVEYMAQVRDNWHTFSGREDTGLEAETLVSRLTRALKLVFAEVVRVDNPSEALTAGADLISVVDLYVLIGQGTGQTTEVDLKVIFTRLDGHPIQTVSGVGQEKVSFPMHQHHFPGASIMALTSFEESLAHFSP